MILNGSWEEFRTPSLEALSRYEYCSLSKGLQTEPLYKTIKWVFHIATGPGFNQIRLGGDDGGRDQSTGSMSEEKRSGSVRDRENVIGECVRVNR